jgi:hypothetical protein
MSAQSSNGVVSLSFRPGSCSHVQVTTDIFPGHRVRGSQRLIAQQPERGRQVTGQQARRGPGTYREQETSVTHAPARAAQAEIPGQAPLDTAPLLQG